MHRNILSILTLILVCCLPAAAQELNCKVKVMHEKITNTDPQVFRTMERAITEFMNTRKWGTDEFQPAERIDCNILINLTAKVSGNDDAYTATINVQASRPVYNTSYSSPTVNFIDRDLVFQYSQFNPLQFDDNRVSGTNALESNLTAVLAFYAYVILGLDYGSFAPGGGTPWYKKAQNIVNNAPEQGKSIPGWKAFDSRTNRYWLIDQMLNPRFAAFHSFWYLMHREALDNMSTKPVESRQQILGGISALQQLQKDNPGSILLQFFFNAKSDEFLRILSQLPKDQRTQYVNTLAQIDVPNAARYNSLK
jgi:hypothetical protein